MKHISKPPLVYIVGIFKKPYTTKQASANEGIDKKKERELGDVEGK